MKQGAYKSRSGMFTRFTPTRTVRVSDLNQNNVLRVLDSIHPNGPFFKQPLALVEETTKSNGVRFKQTRVLKAALLSEDLFLERLERNKSILPYLEEIRILDDFLLPEDRFSRSIAKIFPYQTMRRSFYEVSDGGIVEVGVPFEEGTLQIHSGLSSVLVNGSLGVVEFPEADAGKTVELSFVTKELHPILRIQRHRGIGTVYDLKAEIYSYVINPTVVKLLDLDMPA